MNKTKKNMNYCKPSKRKSNFTCYSKSSLINMTKAWNKKYNEQLSYDLNSDQLWNNLNNKLSSKCTTEWCWKDLDFIQKINDKEIKNTFRPKMPKEWHSNPNAWLSTLDIDIVMEQYMNKFNNFVYLGTVPMDFDDQKYGRCLVSDICKFKLTDYINQNVDKLGVVFNLDKSHQSGSHWVCMFIDIKLNNIYYWDSYGVKPDNEVIKLANKIKKQGLKINKKFNFYINTFRHQYKNSECGVYCLWFLIKLIESSNSYTTYNKIIIKKVKDTIMQQNRNVLFVR